MARAPLGLVLAVILAVLAACGDDAPAHLTTSVDHAHASAEARPAGAGADADAAATSPDAAPDAADSGDDASVGDGGDAIPSNDATDATTSPDATAATDATTTGDTSVVDTVVPPRPPPPLPPLDAAQLAAVDAGMSDALDVPALAGRTFGGLVVDLDTDQTVWASAPDKVLIPASNTKILTTACAIDRLGEDHRMLTRVMSAGNIDASGTLTADLDLHSEHDFTWSRWFYGDERHPLDRLADALWRAGLRKVSGNIGIWGGYLYDGYHFGTYDPATQRQRAGAAWSAALAARGIQVTGSVVEHATMELPPGHELARWDSLPLAVGEWAINHVSHNEMADILQRHAGWLLGGSSDYDTGAEVIADWLASTGTDTTGFEVHDGSGLSVDNRISARQLVGVYRYMTKSPRWPAWKSTLSVGGAEGPGSVDGDGEAIVTTNSAPYNGTLAYRMSGADTAGRVFGKSGTNAGITTSGVLYNRWDGHRYAFAFLMNTLPSGSANTARATQDDLVAVVAKNLRGTPARPATPTLGCVRGRADGRIEVALTPVDGLVPAEDTAGYFVETSADGLQWRDEDRRFTLSPELVLPASSTTVYVRVRAATLAGLSDPSDVYAARALPAAPAHATVLLVDADDRWQRQPVNENPMGAAHAFMVAYAAAMPDGVAFDTCPNEATTDGDVALATYDAVVWDAAEESATDESVSAAEQAALADYLGLGGALFVSGAEIGWDLDPSGNPAALAADRAFYQTWLRAGYAGDDAGVYVAEGVPGSIFAGLDHDARLGFWTPGQIFVAFPDELAPAGGATACMTYDGPGTTACVQYQGDYDLVSLGFPFESIDGAAERAAVMARVLAFFGLTGG
ncbi:MAG: D-alanyl-D-alanine carboxypeptidase [Myxococcota bacterium]